LHLGRETGRSLRHRGSKGKVNRRTRRGSVDPTSAARWPFGRAEHSAHAAAGHDRLPVPDRGLSVDGCSRRLSEPPRFSASIASRYSARVCQYSTWLRRFRISALRRSLSASISLSCAKKRSRSPRTTVSSSLRHGTTALGSKIAQVFARNNRPRVSRHSIGQHLEQVVPGKRRIFEIAHDSITLIGAYPYSNYRQMAWLNQAFRGLRADRVLPAPTRRLRECPWLAGSRAEGHSSDRDDAGVRKETSPAFAGDVPDHLGEIREVIDRQLDMTVFGVIAVSRERQCTPTRRGDEAR
jgi:hypothetical protein